MELKIYIYGDPVLRQKAKPVEVIDEEIKKLVKAMILIMDQSKGIGIAAPQVGKSLRIFVIREYDKDNDGDLCEPEVFINPVLSEPGTGRLIDEEGCLSIPNIYASVIRPDAITVEALDIEGKPFKKTFYKYSAREIMHENDHLNGVLFVDRVEGKERKELQKKLQKLKKSQKNK